jgi:methionine--tRNA ligase beta chain
VAGRKLVQRNAILRSLVSTALHGQFAQYAGDNFGLLTQFMSMADQIRNSKQRADDNFLNGLDQILRDSAYLVPSATCTVADLDMAVALLETCNTANLGPCVIRWLYQVTAVLQELSQKSGVSLPQQLILSKPSQCSVFFYGTEDAEEVLSSLYKSDQQEDKQPKKSEINKDKQKQDQTQKDQPKKEKQQTSKTETKKEAKGGGDQAPATYDIHAMDIRVGKIVKVWDHESADKLYCEEIDLGTETRQIASGLRPFLAPTELQDKLVLVLCNLKKLNLKGFPSHGMVLCASNAEHTAVELVVPPEGTSIGERVVFDGVELSDPEPENKVAKKKIFEQLAPDLQTNADGIVVWKGHVAKTSAGVVAAVNKMPSASVK